MPTVTEEDEKEPSQLNKGEPPLTTMSDDVHVVDQQAKVRLAMDNRAALSHHCSVQVVEPAVSVVGQQQSAEERAHGSISMKTYYRYLTTQSGHFLTLLAMVVFMVGEVHAALW